MSRAGMTILELLLALALLSGLTIACVSWTTAATRALADQGGDAAWRQGASRALACIDDALATADRADGRENRRVLADPRSLAIRSRQVVTDETGAAALAETVEFSLAGASLVASYRDSDGSLLAQRPLLGGMLGLDIVVTEIDTTHARMAVNLRGERDGKAERSWTLSKGDLQ